jgi:hypothetical protein
MQSIPDDRGSGFATREDHGLDPPHPLAPAQLRRQPVEVRVEGLGSRGDASHHPRSRRLATPDQLRRRERWRPCTALKGVEIECRSGHVEDRNQGSVRRHCLSALSTSPRKRTYRRAPWSAGD